MIDLDAITEAYTDIIGSGSDEGFDFEQIQDRFEMMGIDWSDFRRFLTERVAGLEEAGINTGEEWAKGYISAAMEWFLYGNLTGKIAAVDEELDGFNKD